MNADEVIAEARDQIDEAVRRVIEARAIENTEAGSRHPFVTGWIVVYEFTNEELETRDESADGVITPGPQSRATSRGLLGLGRDAFTR